MLFKDTWDPSVLMGLNVAAYLQSTCEAERTFCGKVKKDEEKKISRWLAITTVPDDINVKRLVCLADAPLPRNIWFSKTN